MEVDNMEIEEKFNPWNVTSIEDFLFYCCPECDNKTVTKSDFIQHAKCNHPRSQNIICSLEVIPRSVTESESYLTDEFQAVQNIDSTEIVTHNYLPEEIHNP